MPGHDHPTGSCGKASKEASRACRVPRAARLCAPAPPGTHVRPPRVLTPAVCFRFPRFLWGGGTFLCVLGNGGQTPLGVWSGPSGGFCLRMPWGIDPAMGWWLQPAVSWPRSFSETDLFLSEPTSCFASPPAACPLLFAPRRRPPHEGSGGLGRLFHVIVRGTGSPRVPPAVTAWRFLPPFPVRRSCTSSAGYALNPQRACDVGGVL